MRTSDAAFGGGCGAGELLDLASVSETTESGLRIIVLLFVLPLRISAKGACECS